MTREPLDLEDFRARLDPESSIQVCPNEHTITRDSSPFRDGSHFWVTCAEYGFIGSRSFSTPDEETMLPLYQSWVREVMADHTEVVLRGMGFVLVAEVERLRGRVSGSPTPTED